MDVAYKDYQRDTEDVRVEVKIPGVQVEGKFNVTAFYRNVFSPEARRLGFDLKAKGARRDNEKG